MINNMDSDFYSKNLNIGFIGFGLIGGSIAQAIRKSKPSYTLLSYNHHKPQPSSDLINAVSDGVLDTVLSDLNTFIPKCDIIFLCAPVLNNIDYLKLIKPFIKFNCIITDVGSVKGSIHEAALKLGLGEHFIGGHPMTGSEKTGYLSSYALLLENAYYILTPTPYTSSDKLKLLLRIIKEMGSIPILLKAKEHDKITAAISHLPHIIAAQLVNLIKESDDSNDKMRDLAAGGFKDITRIASSSPIMWQNICLTNSKDIRQLLDKYISSLTDVSNALYKMDGEYLYNIFDTASTYRSLIPNKSTGLIKKFYEIYLDITDETGAIATIATLLAGNSISIKNIGIIHNREFEEGVLRIEFYDDNSMDKAVALLKKHSYHIYER